jgi:hypothetical protein
MTPHRPDGDPRPFTPGELGGLDDVPADELAADVLVARELEGVADRGTVRPSDGFADRVMAAVAAEPAPAPVRAAGAAVRRGSLAALGASLRDAWRVSTRTGFPMAARAQAMALVLVVMALAAGGGIATAGALGLLGDHGPNPGPTLTAAPATLPVATETPEATNPPATPDGTLEPATDGSPEATESPSAEPQETVEPTETPESHGGSSGGSPTERPASTSTPEPTAEPASTAEDGGQGSDGATPGPTETPNPTQSADH